MPGTWQWCAKGGARGVADPGATIEHALSGENFKTTQA